MDIQGDYRASFFAAPFSWFPQIVDASVSQNSSFHPFSSNVMIKSSEQLLFLQLHPAQFILQRKKWQSITLILLLFPFPCNFGTSSYSYLSCILIPFKQLIFLCFYPLVKIVLEGRIDQIHTTLLKWSGTSWILWFWYHLNVHTHSHL